MQKLLLRLITLVFFVFNCCFVQRLRAQSFHYTDKASIMNALYHNCNAGKNSSQWVGTDKDILAKFDLNRSSPFTSKLLSVDSLGDGANKRLFILLSINPVGNDCYACAPLIKLLTFSKRGSFWVFGHGNIADRMGVMGTPPPVESIKTGKSIMFLFHPSSINMGETTESLTLYGIYDNTFKEVFSINSASYSNSGACDTSNPNSCYEYIGKLKFTNQNKAFGDLILTKKGTDISKGKVIKIDSAITYKFINGHYIKQ